MKQMPRISPHSPRSGWTLIEMVLVVTATAILSAVGVTVITLLMQMEQAGTVALARQRAASNLALQLRADGHQSTNVELLTGDDGPTQVRLTLPESQSVTWSARNGTVTRVLSEEDRADRREAYHFPECSARWSLTDDARHLSLHLSTDTAVATTTEPESVEAFDATIDVNLGHLIHLGRQLRLASSTDSPDSGQSATPGEEE